MQHVEYQKNWLCKSQFYKENIIQGWKYIRYTIGRKIFVIKEKGITSDGLNTTVNSKHKLSGVFLYRGKEKSNVVRGYSGVT